MNLKISFKKHLGIHRTEPAASVGVPCRKCLLKGKAWLDTVDLLIKIGYFAKEKNIVSGWKAAQMN
jgi:hypothetical protein